MKNLEQIEEMLIKRIKEEKSQQKNNFTKKSKSYEFLKEHYKKCLQLISPIMLNGKIIIKEFQYNIIMHLFRLTLRTDYIPSVFIKQIAEMSSFTTIEIEGYFSEIKSHKSTEFLTMYYKIVSVIMNNKYIKESKKKFFESVMTEKLNEKTISFFMSLITQSNESLDPNSKILIKAITQNEFEFFEVFAHNFKKVLFELIYSKTNRNWINKYVFKIIEKCLIKLPKVEKDFLLKLGEICHSLMDLFLIKKNMNIKKLYRQSMRIIYIIYHKRNERLSKILKFFDLKFKPILEMKELSKEFIIDTINDFFEVNLYILNQNSDISQYYKYFYEQLLKSQNVLETEIYNHSIEEIFKYEMKMNSNDNNNISFLRKLLKDFCESDEKKNQLSINLICEIIKKFPSYMKIKIVEEISLTNFSFFNNVKHIPFLVKLLESLEENTNEQKILDYYMKYLDTLFIHMINRKYSSQRFIQFLDTVNCTQEKKFYLTIKYANKFFIYLQENNLFIRGDLLSRTKTRKKTTNKLDNPMIKYNTFYIPIKGGNEDVFNIDEIVINFLRILALNSVNIEYFPENRYQELLNIYSFFIIYKITMFPEIEYNSKLLILSNNSKNDIEYSVYLLIFSNNLPQITFNRNTCLTTPIKIEISPLLLTQIKGNKKILPSEFSDFGITQDINIETKIYLLGIYYQFVSKYYLINVIFNKEEPWPQQLQLLANIINIDQLYHVKISLINLFYYMSDNLFITYNDNKEFLSRMFSKFEEKNFKTFRSSFNTIFKQKIISHDLKLLLNFACYFNEDISEKAIKLIKKYAKYFPFLLNEYDIFEYYVNILGVLIYKTIQKYDFYITEFPMEGINIPLEISSDNKKLAHIYKNLSKIFEKSLQKSYMINNNNISFNMSNYMNQYTINPTGRGEIMNFSVNLLQKIYNNIKKIEIPPTLKTSAYLEAEKFQNYYKTHVKKNYDKYLSLASVNDIFSPGDYSKSTKLQLRNKYIGIVEGKMNNLKSEYNNDDECYYKFKSDITKKIIIYFKEEQNIDSLTNKMTSIMIELSAFIIYIDRKDFMPTFNKSIIRDEILNIITSISMTLYNTSSYETICFCWEWILYFKHDIIQIVLNNIKNCILNKESNFISGSDYTKKNNSDIFNLINTLEESIIKSQKDYEVNLPKKIKEIEDSIYQRNIINNNKSQLKIQLINEKLNKNCNKITYEEFINSRIILLKFLKECMNEFCKCDMEKLTRVYKIIKILIDEDIDINRFKVPIYIYLHFLVLNISLEIIDIFSVRLSLFKISENELLDFKLRTILYALNYFLYDNQRRLIPNKFILQETQQTMINCEELLHSDKNKKKEINPKNRIILKLLVEVLGGNIQENKKNKITFEDFEKILIFLIESEMNRLKYWNNPSASHTSSMTGHDEEKIKKLLTNIFNYSDKLSIKLIQRFPWIQKKYPYLIASLGEKIYSNKKEFYNEPYALNILIEYIIDSNKNDLKKGGIMKHFICWKLPLLNFSLQYISLKYDDCYYLHKFCTHILNHSSTTAIIFYLPQLIQSLRTETHFQVPSFILKKCKESSMITHQFLWALNVEEIMSPKIKKRYLPKNYIEKIKSYEISKILRFKIIKNLNYIQRKFWYEEDKIFSDINEVSACFLHPEGDYAHLNLKMTKEEKTEFVVQELTKLQGKILPYIYLPTNPTYKLSNILPKSAVTLQSAKKVPFIVSFEAVEYPGPDNEKSINNMSLIDFIEFQFESDKKNIAPLIVSLIHSYRNRNEMYSITARTNDDKNYNKYNNMISDDEDIESNNLNNGQNSNVSLSDLDINDEGNIYNDTAQEKDNPQNLYIPILEPRAFRDNNNNIENGLRINTIDKDNFPNDSAQSITNLNFKYTFNNNGIDDKKMINEKLKNNFLGAYENNNAQNILTISPNSKDVNKLTISPKNKKYNSKVININEINNNFFVNQKSIDINNIINIKNANNSNNPNNNYQLDFSFLDDCTLEEKEEESEIKSNKSLSSFNSQNSKLLEQNIEKEPNKINMPCIFKVGDDLRQDSLALQVIQIFKEIFKQSGLNIYTYPYQTISTISPKYKDLGGYIEVVKDTDSRDQIGKTYDTNLYDYYLCSFGQENSNEFREARKNLIESLAAYAVISYILQIKDRHNGNILIDKQGHLIHIDFGFIFDISPAGNMKFEKAEFKLTKEMMQIMGGNNSDAYKTFVDLTVKAYLACRDNMNKLLDPVVLMFSSGLDCFRENSIKNFIDRFKLELNEEEAVKYMKDIIETAEDNWRTNVYDFIQKKQNNIYY
jgi:hypothetical protein